MSDNLQCDSTYEDAPFCTGLSDQDEYEFVPPPIDCASGPDPFTDEWWGAEGSDWWNECAAPLLEVELGEPQVIEREDYLENGVVTSDEATTVATVAHDDADILPVTGAEVPALAALGVAALLGGAAVLRRFSRA